MTAASKKIDHDAFDQDIQAIHRCTQQLLNTVAYLDPSSMGLVLGVVLSLSARLCKIAMHQSAHIQTTESRIDLNWTNARERLLHGLYHIRDMECADDHDDKMLDCPRRSAKEAIDNRPCSICAKAKRKKKVQKR